MTFVTIMTSKDAGKNDVKMIAAEYEMDNREQ
jgi:hypothetical protein